MVSWHEMTVLWLETTISWLNIMIFHEGAFFSLQTYIVEHYIQLNFFAQRHTVT